MLFFSKTLVVLIIYTNQAVQQNTVSRSCTATLIVKVLDINDNIPIFNPTEYRTNITEHSSVGTTVVHLRATDLDVCNISQRICCNNIVHPCINVICTCTFLCLHKLTQHVIQFVH